MRLVWGIALSLFCGVVTGDAAIAARDTNGVTVRVLAINYDPVADDVTSSRRQVFAPYEFTGFCCVRRACS